MEILAYSIAIFTPIIIYIFVIYAGGMLSTKGEMNEYMAKVENIIVSSQNSKSFQYSSIVEMNKSIQLKALLQIAE